METSPLICSAMDWFLYDNGLRHERVNSNLPGKANNRNSEERTEKTVTRKQSWCDNQSFIETLRNVNSVAYNFLRHLNKKKRNNLLLRSATQ